MRQQTVGISLVLVLGLAPLVASAQEVQTEPNVAPEAEVAPEPEAEPANEGVEPSEEADVEGDDDGLLFVEADESSPWWIGIFGYIRVAYENVQQDSNVDFVGRNDGFALHNARLGVQGGNTRWFLSWVISLDGAVDIRARVNELDGNLAVRLRDAFFRDDPWPFIGIQAGQFKMPFSAEEIQDSSELMFASRAVGLEGVRVGWGYETPGIVVARQLGVMLAPAEPIFFGDFGLSYYFAIANGNGPNQILNDNDKYAYYGRLELFWDDIIRLGGSFLFNERTVGDLPDLFDEDQSGYSVDLLFTLAGLTVFGQLTSVSTEYPTTGNPTREQLAWHAQIGYRFDQLPVAFGPTYRYAYFHPWAGGGEGEGGIDLDSYQLQYHTFGLNVWSKHVPLNMYINYTLTGEEEPRELRNNVFEVLIQVVF